MRYLSSLYNAKEKTEVRLCWKFACELCYIKNIKTYQLGQQQFLKQFHVLHSHVQEGCRYLIALLQAYQEYRKRVLERGFCCLHLLVVVSLLYEEEKRMLKQSSCVVQERYKFFETKNGQSVPFECN